MSADGFGAVTAEATRPEPSDASPRRMALERLETNGVSMGGELFTREGWASHLPTVNKPFYLYTRALSYRTSIVRSVAAPDENGAVRFRTLNGLYELRPAE